MTRSGYSGKPLYQKPGIRDDHLLSLIDQPDGYIQLLEIPFDPVSAGDGQPADLIHIFAEQADMLSNYLKSGILQIKRDGMIWVSWPKKSSKVVTDISEDTIRPLAFPPGLVNIKVCSVNEKWSALKLVIRKELR